MPDESMKPAHPKTGGTGVRDWWPNQLNLHILHQNSPLSDPMGDGFNYAEEFKSLNLAAVKADLRALRATAEEELAKLPED